MATSLKWRATASKHIRYSGLIKTSGALILLLSWLSTYGCERKAREATDALRDVERLQFNERLFSTILRKLDALQTDSPASVRLPPLRVPNRKEAVTAERAVLEFGAAIGAHGRVALELWESLTYTGSQYVLVARNGSVDPVLQLRLLNFADSIRVVGSEIARRVQVYEKAEADYQQARIQVGTIDSLSILRVYELAKALHSTTDRYSRKAFYSLSDSLKSTYSIVVADVQRRQTVATAQLGVSQRLVWLTYILGTLLVVYGEYLQWLTRVQDARQP